MTTESTSVDMRQEKLGPVSVRPAVPSDLAFIEDVLYETCQNPYGSGNVDEDEVALELGRIAFALGDSNKGATFIAESGGRGLGFAFVGAPDPRLVRATHSDPNATLELRLLYLHPDQRKKGVGRQLITKVEERARESGNSRVVLTSGPRYWHIGTRQFYRRMGYEQLGRPLPKYFDDKYPALAFYKDLQ